MTTVVPSKVKLAGLWWRLARDKAGAPLYRQRPAPFYPAQVSQGDMGEAQVSPDGRTPQSLRDLSGGAGLAQQPLAGDFNRYDRGGAAEGEGLDPTLSPDGPLILSGRMTVATPAGTPPNGPMAGGLWHAGQERVFFPAGRYVYAFDGAQIAQVGDLGAGVAASGNIVSFAGAAGAGAPTWYCPVGYGAPLRFSNNEGNVWAPVSTGGDVTNVQSLVEMDGEVVVAMRSPRYGDAMVAVFDNGGVEPTLYSVIDPIGDASNPISRLMVHRGRVLVIKDREGVFLLTDDRRSMEEDLFPELRGVRIFAGGACVWRGVLFLPTEWGLFGISPGLGLQQVGPSQHEFSYVGGAAPRGMITACDGDAHNLYAWRGAAVAGGPAWLYKANAKVGPSGVDEIAWFPWSQQANNARCESIATVTARPDGASPDASRPYLLVGRTLPQGTQTPPEPVDRHTFAWYRLPARGKDPRTDPEYPYAPAGTLYYSRLNGRFPAIDKAWYGLTPLCAPLDYKLDGATPTRAHGLRLLWKRDTDPLVPAAAFGGYTSGTLQTSGVGTRERLLLFSRGLDPGIRLTTDDPTTTPQVYAVTAEYDLRALAVWRHEMTLDISSGAFAGDGSQGYGDPLPPGPALQALRALPGASGSLQLLDPWDNEYEVAIPPEGVALRAAGGEEAGYDSEVPLLVDVVCTEQFVRQVGTWGSVARLTWRRVADYTWRQVTTIG